MDVNATIVIDNGSDACKAGFASSGAPYRVPPTIVHRSQWKDTGTGDLPFMYPIEDREIINWDAMQGLWQHIYQHELHTASEEHPVLHTESAMAPRYNQERMSEVMFEFFNVPTFYVSKSAVLSLHACGRTTGLVLDCGGQGSTNVVPVYEGYALRHAITRKDMSGLSEDLETLLIKLRYGVPYTTAWTQIVEDMKEKLCYVALDFEQELRIYGDASTRMQVEKTYELPDGRVISVGDERFRAPEALFEPSPGDLRGATIQDTLYKAIDCCDPDLHKDLYGNIVLSGGSTLFPGLENRLHKELAALAPPATNIQIVAPPERKYSAWIGGSIFASLSTFQQVWITKGDYDEIGPPIVHRKCF